MNYSNSNRNKRKFEERFEKFIQKFYELNDDILDQIGKDYNECEELPCRKIIIYNDGRYDIALPRGYRVIENINKNADMSNSSYIFDEDSRVVCGISYNLTSSNGKVQYFDSITHAYPERHIISYEQYILEKAAILTEQYAGESRSHYLKLAILKMLDGNYNYFPKDDNIRFKLKSIPSRKLFKAMANTLEKRNRRVIFISTNMIINNYVDYIKNKVNEMDTEKNKTYVKTIK